jgi:hypothetical protein
MRKKELRSGRRHFRHAAAKTIHGTGLKTGHYKGKREEERAGSDKHPGNAKLRVGGWRSAIQENGVPGWRR